MAKVLFIHHSVGRALIRNGRVRERLTQLTAGNLEFWDHDYNRKGLFGPKGERHEPFPIPHDNTNPDGLFSLFSDVANGDAVGDRLREYDLVVMKSCFPNANVRSDDDLQTLKEGYTQLATDASQAGLSVALLTTPPIRTGIMTTNANARRAAEIARWLCEESPIERVFDLFGALSNTDSDDRNFGRLKGDYTNFLLLDSHPTRKAGEDIGPALSEFILSSVESAVPEGTPLRASSL